MRTQSGFGYRDEHRPSFVVGLCLAVLLAVATSCSSATARKLIVSANEAQDAAARTYDAAKVVEADAQKACRAALVAAQQPLPTKPEDIRPICEAVGVRIPYDPVKLQKAAGPINALYDGVRAANTERIALGGDKADITTQTAITLGGLLAQVVADLAGAGIAVPPSVGEIAGLLAGAGSKP